MQEGATALRRGRGSRTWFPSSREMVGERKERDETTARSPACVPRNGRGHSCLCPTGQVRFERTLTLSPPSVISLHTLSLRLLVPLLAMSTAAPLALAQRVVPFSELIL